MRVIHALHPGTAVPGLACWRFFFVARAFQPEHGVAGLLFRGVFLTTEDTEVTEQETAGRWYFFVSAFYDLASARYGRDAIAPSPPTPLPLRGRGGDFVFLIATKSRTAPLAPGRGEGSGVRGKRTSPMPFPQPGCSSRCWCQASRRRQSAGARAAGRGRLCASSLRCTRALPYPAHLLAIFFVARTLQPEQRAAIFLSPWCSVSRVSGPLTPDPSPPAGARGGFC